MTVITQTASRYLLPLLLLFSLFLLLRGHNQPGGGFVGGLVAAAAFTLYGLAYGAAQVQAMLRVESRTLIGLGLAVALTSGLPGLLTGQALSQAVWLDVTIPVLGKFGTPFLFDVGVYLTVIGIVLKILLILMADGEARRLEQGPTVKIRG